MPDATDPLWYSSDETFGHKVTLQMYHNSPPVAELSECGREEAVWCMHAWDPNMVAAALTESGLVKHTAVYDEPPFLLAYKGIMTTSSHCPPREDVPDMDVWFLLGSTDALKGLANKWSDLAIKDAESVGGDDSYFDYYPDFLAGLWQLCRAIDYPDPYMAAASAAWAGSYHGDEEALDLIPPYNHDLKED